MNPREQSATFWEHLQELRSVLIRSLIVIAAGMAGAFIFSDLIISWLVRGIPSQSLGLFSPQEGLVTVFKLSFWVGVLATSPYWLFSLLKFVQPALKNSERALLPLFLLLSLLFIAAGLSLALFMTIPMANSYLYEYNSSIGLNLWGFASYIDYLLILLFAHGATFETGAFLLLLIHLKLIHWQTLAGHRRSAVLFSLIVGAVLTPPDVLTQLLVAVPLYGFYELAILYGKLICLRVHAPDHCGHAHQEKDAIPPPAN